MRILIAGDRRWQCRLLAARIVYRLIERNGRDITIVHSGGCGVDEALGCACRQLGIDVEAHPVTDQWLRRFGPAEREHRNLEMIQAGADLCIAVHRDLGGSIGTKDCARQAIAAGISTYLIASVLGRPERIRLGDRRVR